MRLAAAHQQRPGITILEVIVATAVFLFAMSALLKLSSFGSTTALAVQQKNRATELAQSKMAEVVAGAVPLSGQGATPFDEAPDYQWSMSANPAANVNGLFAVTVTVTHNRLGSQTPLQVSMSRMVLTPSYRGNIAVPAAPPTDSSTQASSSSTGSSSSSSASSSTPNLPASVTGANKASTAKTTTPAAKKTTTTGGTGTKTGGTTGNKSGGTGTRTGGTTGTKR